MYTISEQQISVVPNLPKQSLTFKNKTVILGSNGAGKTTLLRLIFNQLRSNFGDRQTIYFEGSRRIGFPGVINAHEAYSTYEKAKDRYYSERMHSVEQRAQTVLILLERQQDSVYTRHGKRTAEWQANGQTGPMPQIEELPLQKLFDLFTSVFPEIVLKFETGAQNTIRACKYGEEYPFNNLSDGEHQALFLFADLVLATQSDSLILVDEPELHLNPLLANRIWDTIEQFFPEAVFIYTTHSISFAMRDNVEKIIALSGASREALEIEAISELPTEDMQEFLGAIPLILSSDKAILIEGLEGSVDIGFYQWLTGHTKAALVPLGSYYDVQLAITRQGVWAKLAPGMKLVGIIDRDARQAHAQHNNLIVLDYQEVESYFCHPDLLCALAAKSPLKEPAPTKNEIEQVIRTTFSDSLLRIVASRTAEQAKGELGVSLENEVLRKCQDINQLREHLKIRALEEAQKATQFVGEEVVLRIFEKEWQNCQDTLANNDIEKMLCLTPGKTLLAKLALAMGHRDGKTLTINAKSILNPQDFPHTKRLQDALANTLL